MNKITQLYRLDFKNSIVVLGYLLKRIFKLKVTHKEQFVNEYYYHLIRFNGFLMIELKDCYISKYKDFDLNIKIRKRPSSDLDVFTQIFHYKEYQPVIDKYLQSFNKKQNLSIIDAGSNIGLTSVIFSKYFSKSTIISIEPDSSNFEIMSYNLDTNNVDGIQLKSGVWSKDCFLEISRDFRDKNDWSIRVEETNKETDLKAYSISSIMKNNNLDEIDILKIDIEGSENEVFTSKDSDLSFLNKTKCIALEIHDEFNCRNEIYEILKDNHFDFFESGELTIGINKNYLRDKV